MIRNWQLRKQRTSSVKSWRMPCGMARRLSPGMEWEVAIVLSFAEYQKMIASKGKLSAFFRDSPLVVSSWILRGTGVIFGEILTYELSAGYLRDFRACGNTTEPPRDQWIDSVDEDKLFSA